MTSDGRPRIAGYDVASELMGKQDFASIVALRLTGVLPTPQQHRLTDALLVMLVEHGMSPSAIATRLTHLAEPNALAPAVASGLMGVGSRFLGTARLVSADLARHWRGTESADAVADRILSQYEALGQYVPGFGHPIHGQGDPRVPVIESIAAGEGVHTRSVEVMHTLENVLSEKARKTIPLNAAGAMGAAIYDLGFPAHYGTAIAIISRACGLIGHFYEEDAAPIAPNLWKYAREEFR